ncbi:MAG: transposase [Pirellulales bacterium]|nr:transposase [Pirellulales bacterium]
MRRQHRKRHASPAELDVFWEIQDELWACMEPILRAYWPARRTGRKVANWRASVNGIIFRMRTGCAWNGLPRQFGDDSTVHRWFRRWCQDGAMQRI